jgi:hypothetical protein
MFHGVLQGRATKCMAATTYILTSRSGLVSRFINALFSMLIGQSGENSLFGSTVQARSPIGRIGDVSLAALPCLGSSIRENQTKHKQVIKLSTFHLLSQYLNRYSKFATLLPNMSSEGEMHPTCSSLYEPVGRAVTTGRHTYRIAKLLSQLSVYCKR